MSVATNELLIEKWNSEPDAHVINLPDARSSTVRFASDAADE